MKSLPRPCILLNWICMPESLSITLYIATARCPALHRPVLTMPLRRAVDRQSFRAGARLRTTRHRPVTSAARLRRCSWNSARNRKRRRCESRAAFLPPASDPDRARGSRRIRTPDRRDPMRAGAPVCRHLDRADAMPGLVQRRSDQIVHSGVHDREIPRVASLRRFQVFDAGQQHAAVCNEETTRFDRNASASRPCSSCLICAA